MPKLIPGPLGRGARRRTAGSGAKDSLVPAQIAKAAHYPDVDVAIVMESTYPYLKGGVSAVVHDIVTGNPDLTFGIIHIAWDSNAPHEDLYGMPANVAWVRIVYLSMQEHRHDFLAVTPADLHLGRRGRLALSHRLVSALKAMSQDNNPEPLWSLIDEGINERTRQYPLWALLGSKEFMEVWSNEMGDLGLSLSQTFWSLRAFFSLAYAVLGETMPRASVYHAHTTGYASLLAAAAARDHGTKFLLTEHNLYVRDTVNTRLNRRMDKIVTADDYRTFDVPGEDRMWMAWWIEMGRMCYPSAYKITYLYPNAITEAEALGSDRSKSVVVPNGMIISTFDRMYQARLEERKKIRAAGVNHTWRLVYIARLVPIKGLLDLLDAMAIMRDRGMNVHLDVLGPTEHVPEYYQQCVARISELKMEDMVEIRGTVNVREHLNEFDLLVLSSYNEGQPIVSLETMAAGIPTVSTDVGGVSQVVEDILVADDGTEWEPCGFLVTPGEPEQMADRVQEIISDVDLYERFCDNARGRVEAFFRLEAVNAMYHEIYREGGA